MSEIESNAKARNRQIKYLLILCLLLVLISGFVILVQILLAENAATRSEEISISLDSGFYSENQIVTVNVPDGTKVYYTDNCEAPTKENGREYHTPIQLVASEEETVQVLRFKAYSEDGTESEIMNRTYFLGTNIANRYTTNVLHVLGEPEDLFGYENGIFVGGKRLDEFIEANPDAHFGGSIDANFEMRGRASERPVYVEYFSNDGERLLFQNAGVRIHGAATRMKNQKSFRLYARSEYDEKNKFEYPILKNLLSEADGTIAQEHKRLIVRNGGTDNGFAYIRSELIGALASEAGFPDVMHAEPVCVYINGMYQGVYWIENNFDKQYFENRYGEYTGEFVVVEGGDKTKRPDDDTTLQKYAEEYNEMYAKFSSMDLTIDENFEALEQVLDVENYLQYFAIENYVGNSDWPGNNVKVYKYIAADNQYTEDSVYDGRYRHVLFDTDCGFGLLVEQETVGITASTYTLERILGDKTPLFAALMERKDCREYFVKYSLDLMNGSMAYDNVEKKLSQMHSSREQELRYMLEETDIQKDSIWFWEDDSIWYYDNVERSYETILNFAKDRPQTVLSDIISSFGYDFMDAYTLNIYKGNCRSNIQVNGIGISEAAFSGSYLMNIPVTITPNLAKNEVFDHWLVNGTIREEETLNIVPADMTEQQVSVELVVHETDTPILQINAIKAKGNSDFVELINNSNQAVSTSGYFMSDSEDRYKYTLPTVTLLPGESKRFYGKDCAEQEALGELSLNFNLKEGEHLTLTYNTMVLESIAIPDLSENGIYQYDNHTGKFKELN